MINHLETKLKESKFMLDHLQVYNQKDQSHDSSVDLMVLIQFFSFSFSFLFLHTVYRKKKLKKKHDLQQYRTNKYK